MAEYTPGDAELGAIVRRVKAVKNDWAKRDMSAALMRAVLSGDWEKVAPGAFTEDYPAPMVANRIKVMSKDVAASLAPLPSINCSATNSMNEAAKKRAETRGRIANGYIRDSHLEPQMTDYTTGYNSFGLGVFFIEPDFDEKAPRIRVRKGSNAYAIWNGAGETVVGFEEFCQSAEEVIALFPDSEAYLRQEGHEGKNKLTIVRYSDKDKTVVFLPECSNHVLTSYAAPIPGRSQYVCIPLPGEGASFNGPPAGAYDDLIWPLMADHEFRMLALEAASKAVQAPLAVPSDVTDVSFGPDAIIRTQQPQNVRRVATEVPQAAFAAGQLLREDLGVGGMSPESRTGNIQASVITGRGIEAASAGYSSQIANAQLMIKFALEQAIECCFRMDEELFGDVEKTITGMEQGAPYSLKYKPSKDINGDHTVDVSYGFLQGMAPNNALVFILQATSAGLYSRESAARQLPVSMNVAEELHKIDLESLRNSILQGLGALAQAIPSMILQQQDPTDIIAKLSAVTDGVKKGQQLEDIVASVFAPQPPPSAPGSDAAAASDSAAAPGGAGGGAPGPDGLTPGAQSLGPNDRPDLQMMFAGVGRNGNAVLQGGVSTQNPVMGR